MPNPNPNPNPNPTAGEPALRFEVRGRAVSANMRLTTSRTTGRPILRAAARQWKEAVALEAFVAEAGRLAQGGKRAQPLRTPLRVVCHVYGTRADADNLSKLIVDGLKEGIGVDDRHFRAVEMHATREGVKTPHTVVEVWELAAAGADAGQRGVA